MLWKTPEGVRLTRMTGAAKWRNNPASNRVLATGNTSGADFLGALARVCHQSRLRAEETNYFHGSHRLNLRFLAGGL